MKLASRISSIRRHAWKQCRSCSADSHSMWRDSFARCALAGWMRSPSRLEHRRDRVLGQPVDLEVGMELAQLVGDRDVALGVAEPDRRGDVEARACGARLAAHPAARRPRRRCAGEVAQQQVDLHRVARVREVARALEDHERAADQLRERGAGVVGADGVVAAVDDEHRAVDAGEQLAHALLVREPRCELGRDQRLGVGLEAPSRRVLALLGRVRLGEDLREEELEEVLVVLEPVVAVPLLPAVVVVARLAELLLRLQRAGQPAAAAAPAR